MTGLQSTAASRAQLLAAIAALDDGAALLHDLVVLFALGDAAVRWRAAREAQRTAGGGAPFWAASRRAANALEDLNDATELLEPTMKTTYDDAT